ncbi:ThiF family adenylyltransferase [Oxalobacteraceae bacterium R-40]|uniref:ThiF family adenylyltransferase n=1 Tax=Keguizhuia sedimenti TaxID=3064264 RepID=A0ABU1BVE3_9BURK|nr:ThiF family adenylyltransferase [Oxalobacteraceae bacterium R-40]
MDPKWKNIVDSLGKSGFVNVPSPIHSALSANRYDANPADGWFYGKLKAKKGSVFVYLSVPDLSFQRPPSVWMPQRPPWLKGWRPHLLNCGIPLVGEWVCYSDHERYQLLPHEPSRALLRVIEDAEITLDRIADPVTVIEDSKREMALLWNESSYLIYIDVEPSDKLEICRVGVIDHGGSVYYLISQDPHRLATKLGLPAVVPIKHHAIIFPEQTKQLYLTSAGPPRTLKDIREWLMTTNPDLHDEWRRVLLSQDMFRKPLALHFFRTAGQVIGFYIPKEVGLSSVSGQRLVKRFIDQSLFKSPPTITRLSAIRLDDMYLIRRNLAPEMPDLRGLKILLIGCGTIGGYLSWSLVQLGAGINTKSTNGLLTLCDPQKLTSQNIGRHFLGMNYLGQFKATALRNEIMNRRHGVSIDAVPNNFSHIEARIRDFDVIINASGYESFGRYITGLLRKENWFSKSRALLHSWVEGRGGVTRSLLEDSTKSACFDCMWEYPINQEPRLRHPAYSDHSHNAHATDGYATMTPFVVSASMAASSLAVDALLAWRAGNPSPRFRSRSVEGEGIKASLAMDLKRHIHCPSCST